MKNKYFLFFFVSIFLLSCKTIQLIHTSSPGNELFKIAVLYPNGARKTFDMDYYETKHMPMVAGFLGKNLSFYEIDKGIPGRTPTDTIPYLAVGYFYVKDVVQYNKAIGPHIDTIINDIKKYTNIQPIIQVSEVKYVGFNNAQ